MLLFSHILYFCSTYSTKLQTLENELQVAYWNTIGSKLVLWRHLVVEIRYWCINQQADISASVGHWSWHFCLTERRHKNVFFPVGTMCLGQCFCLELVHYITSKSSISHCRLLPSCCFWTCQSRQSTAAVNNISDDPATVHHASPEPSLMLSATPVLFLLRRAKLSAVCFSAKIRKGILCYMSHRL